MVDNETSEALLKLKRPELIDVKLYGKYSTDEIQAVYSDKEQCYLSKNKQNEVTNVCSVKGLLLTLLKNSQDEETQKAKNQQ